MGSEVEKTVTAEARQASLHMRHHDACLASWESLAVTWDHRCGSASQCGFHHWATVRYQGLGSHVHSVRLGVPEVTHIPVLVAGLRRPGELGLAHGHRSSLTWIPTGQNSGFWTPRPCLVFALFPGSPLPSPAVGGLWSGGAGLCRERGSVYSSVIGYVTARHAALL